MRAHKKAILIALEVEITTIHHEFCALIDAGLHQTLNICFGSRGDNRSVVHVIARRVGTHFQSFNPGDQFFHQAICCVFPYGNCDRNSHAAFTGGAIPCAHKRISGLIHIRIGHDDHMVFGTTKTLHPFAVGAACRIDIFGDWGGAHKTYGLNHIVMQDRVNRFFITVHNL